MSMNLGINNQKSNVMNDLKILLIAVCLFVGAISLFAFIQNKCRPETQFPPMGMAYRNDEGCCGNPNHDHGKKNNGDYERNPIAFGGFAPNLELDPTVNEHYLEWCIEGSGPHVGC